MDSRQQRKQDVHRRRLTRSLVFVAVVGAVVLLAFELWLRHVAQDQDPARALHLVAVSALLINLAIAVIAALLGRFLIAWARQTREQGQWPPAGLEWPGNRVARHGADAQRIAARLKAAGIALLLVAFALAGAMAWRALG